MLTKRELIHLLVFLLFGLTACRDGQTRNMPEFGVNKTEINKDIRLFSKNTSLKPSEQIRLELVINSEDEIQIACNSGMMIYYENDGKWSRKEDIPFSILGLTIVAQNNENFNSDFLIPEQKNEQPDCETIIIKPEDPNISKYRPMIISSKFVNVYDSKSVIVYIHGEAKNIETKIIRPVGAYIKLTVNQ